ncbi:MAG: zf-HC2 domain-containing protein [Gammaproteobacteria bacterium]
MSGTTESAGPLADHAELAALLPLYASDALSGAELERMQAHLGDCLACRRELAIERRLADAIRRQAVAGGDVQASFSRLMQRIDDDDPRPASMPKPSTRSMRGPWPALAAAAVFALVAVTVVLRTGAPGGADEPAWRTLAARPADAHAGWSDLHIAFDPALTDAQVRARMGDLPGTILGQPNSAGAFTLRPPARIATAAELHAFMAELRARSGVILVEPVEPLALAPQSGDRDR